MTTDFGPAWGNIASDNAWVGEQNTVIHGGVEFHYSGDTPQDKYRLGVHHLGIGNAERARELIGDAVGHGYVSGEVVFHWALALLSGRVLDQLSEADLTSLNDAFGRRINDGDWARGLHLIRRSFDYSVDVSRNGDESAAGDLETLIKEFQTLPDEQRDQIRRHMDLFLDGVIEDRLHARDYEELLAARVANGRTNRAWKFFHPDPERPRVRKPRTATAPTSAWLRLCTCAAASVIGIGWLTLVLAGRPGIATVVGGLTTITGSTLLARFGQLWIKIRDERRANDLKRIYRAASRPPPGGFAHAVSKMFDSYSSRYAPPSPHGRQWLDETAGLRKWHRDEIVEVYRESRVQASQVAWLVRHRISDVKQRWLKGTLWDYQARLRVPFGTKLAATIGGATAIGGFLWTAGVAVSIQTLQGFAAALLVIAGGIPTTITVLAILRERWRHDAEKTDSGARWKSDRVAYLRWREKLADRPNDREMAAWLDADRRWLKHQAMQIYGLSARDVIAHTFLDGPAKSCKRARTRSGPMRYSKYVLRVYLLTTAGVRQVNADLDFESGRLSLGRRMSFRYEAVASVEVTPEPQGIHQIRLILVNREPVNVKLTDEEPTASADSDDPNVLRRTLQASGLYSTLRILEGIAAEGKEWAGQLKVRRQRKLALLNAAR